MMQAQSLFDDLLEDYCKGQSRNPAVPASQGLKKWPTQTLREQVLTAKQLPQAVVKITNFGKGKGYVVKHLRYISRAAELILENQDGHLVTTLVEQDTMGKSPRKQPASTNRTIFSGNTRAT